jgi:hypothetical protein
MSEREAHLPRLVIDGPREPRVGPFRHRHSPRVRQRARELGASLDRVDGSGPGGRVSQGDVERAADESGSTSGASQPRLAVDGPLRVRLGPYRHTRSPRIRRLARERAVDVARAQRIGPSGSVRPADLGGDASIPVSASRAPRGDNASPSASNRAVRRWSASDVAAGDSARTVQLDLGPTVAAWRRLTAGSRPEGVEATPFLLVAHAVLVELPAVAAAVGGHTAAAGPIVVVLDASGLGGPRPVVDGHHLTILGLLRRLALASHSDADAAAPLAVVGECDGSLSLPPASGHLVEMRLGPLEHRPAVSQDEFGYEVTTIRPTVELTLHHDPERVPDTAVDDFVFALGSRLSHIHRTIGV